MTAIPETHEKIRQTLAKVNALVATEGIRDQGSGQGFRVEAILLQGGKAGQEIAGAARGIGLGFAQTGIIEELPQIGAKVKAGEVIGRLQSIDLDARIEAMELSLKEAEAQVTIGGQNGASSAEKTEARSIVGQVKIQLKALEASRSAYLLVSPLSGTIASIPVRRNQTFDPQEIVALLIPDGQENATTPAPSFDSKTAERYGISKEDMELFDFDGVVELGKPVVTLSKGDRFDFSLGGDYWCRLWVLEVREPYVILNGELGHDQRGTQLESRFYLQKGKPSVVGVTNLNEAIILVLRLLDSP
ncbi:hypothetical protein IIC65_09975 [Candidatus Sumerlaeota bacterium]|nr:hypothetical protein [Candidatus Sumerlaeota bacterium]